jgi:hypothetical protein
VPGISILLGSGDGTFQPQHFTSLDAASQPDSFVVADFNGDGKADVAVTISLLQVGQRAVDVFLGKGDGTFNTPVPYASNSGAGFVIAGDFTGDGRTDLAFVDSHTNSLSVLPGNANGTFQAAVSSPIAPGGPTGPISAADFNHDGKLDIVMASSIDSTLSVFLAAGGGSFNAPLVSNPTTSSSIKFVLVGDFNGDGLPDLLLSDPSGIRELTGQGDGTFQQTSTFLLGPPDTGSPGMGSTAGAVADLNGDGKPDIAVIGSSSGTAYVALGQGNGAFTIAPNIPVGEMFSDSLGVVAADFDGDGKPDLIVANVASRIYGHLFYLRGNGNGTFQTPVEFAQPHLNIVLAPCGICSAPMAVGDLNHDGKLDLVVAEPAAFSLGIVLGNGDGTFQPMVEYRPSPAGVTIVSVGVGDFNGDGKPDVVALANEGGVYLMLGNGDGTLSAAQMTPTPANAKALAVGDMNHDGKADVAVVSDRVTVLLGNGNGTFQTGVDMTLAAPGSDIVLGDFNSDGMLDIAVNIPSDLGGPAPSPQNTIAVLLAGGGTTYYPVGVNTAGISAGISIADLNGDGFPDIISANSGSGDVSVLLGRGDGSFQPAKNFAAQGGVASAVAADFDGDGVPDIAAVANGVSLFLTHGLGSVSVAKLTPNALDFGSELVGTPSANSSVTLKNTGSAALNISGVTIGGAQSGDFAQSNNCGTSLAAGATCTFNVTFTPLNTGARSAFVQIADNAFGSPHLISLSGTGTPAPPDFVVSLPSSTSQVTAGQPASFSLSITPTSGFSQPVSLTCSGAPAASTCSISPSSVTPNGTAAVTAMVTITTTARGSAFGVPSLEIGKIDPLSPYLPVTFAAVLSIAMCGLFLWRRRQAPPRWIPAAGFAVVLAAVMTLTSCGGGSSSGGSGNGGSGQGTGTPAGSYTITVSASSTSGTTTVTHTSKITLVVQ